MGLFWNPGEASRLKADQTRRSLAREQVRIRDTLQKSPVTRGIFQSGGAQGSPLSWQTDATAGASDGYLIIQVDGVTKKVEYYEDA